MDHKMSQSSQGGVVDTGSRGRSPEVQREPTPVNATTLVRLVTMTSQDRAEVGGTSVGRLEV